jgi:hypothetical protein
MYTDIWPTFEDKCSENLKKNHNFVLSGAEYSDRSSLCSVIQIVLSCSLKFRLFVLVCCIQIVLSCAMYSHCHVICSVLYSFLVYCPVLCNDIFGLSFLVICIQIVLSCAL